MGNSIVVHRHPQRKISLPGYRGQTVADIGMFFAPYRPGSNDEYIYPVSIPFQLAVWMSVRNIQNLKYRL